MYQSFSAFISATNSKGSLGFLSFCYFSVEVSHYVSEVAFTSTERFSYVNVEFFYFFVLVCGCWGIYSYWLGIHDHCPSSRCSLVIKIVSGCQLHVITSSFRVASLMSVTLYFILSASFSNSTSFDWVYIVLCIYRMIGNSTAPCLS